MIENDRWIVKRLAAAKRRDTSRSRLLREDSDHPRVTSLAVTSVVPRVYVRRNSDFNKTALFLSLFLHFGTILAFYYFLCCRMSVDTVSMRKRRGQSNKEAATLTRIRLRCRRSICFRSLSILGAAILPPTLVEYQ